MTSKFAAMGICFLIASQASADEPKENGIALNGIALNGLSANGLSANGLSANGLSANGLSANGVGLGKIEAEAGGDQVIAISGRLVIALTGE